MIWWNQEWNQLWNIFWQFRIFLPQMREKNKKMFKKRCSKCKEYKLLKKFSKRYDNRKCKHQSQCKVCSNERIRRYMKEYRLRSYVKAKKKKTRKTSDCKYKKSTKGKIANRKYEKKKSEILHGSYIRKLLTKKSCLSFQDIPQGLVEVKRLQLQLIRKLKNVETKTDSFKTTA